MRKDDAGKKQYYYKHSRNCAEGKAGHNRIVRRRAKEECQREAKNPA